MSTIFTSEFIKQQRELAEKAKPLPWFANLTMPTYERSILSGDPNNHTSGHKVAGNLEIRDADFVVSASNNYPAALDEIEWLVFELDVHQGELTLANTRIAELKQANAWFTIDILPSKTGWYPVWLMDIRTKKVDRQTNAHYSAGIDWRYEDGYEIVFWHNPLPDPPEVTR